MTGTTLHIPTLETERLTLRAPEWSDFDAFAAFRMSERTAFLGGPCTRTQAFDKLGEIIGWKTTVSCVTPGNTRSIALALRMGCTREDDFTTRDGTTLEVYRHPAPEALAA